MQRYPLAGHLLEDSIPQAEVNSSVKVRSYPLALVGPSAIVPSSSFMAAGLVEPSFLAAGLEGPSFLVAAYPSCQLDLHLVASSKEHLPLVVERLPYLPYPSQVLHLRGYVEHSCHKFSWHSQRRRLLQCCGHFLPLTLSCHALLASGTFCPRTSDSACRGLSAD